MTDRVTERLNANNLVNLTDKAIRPNYSPEEHDVGIVHIGIGAFHRGHQAVFTDQAIANSGGNWRIVGASLRSANVSQQLNPQNGLFTVIERSDGNTSARIIASIKEVVNAKEDSAKLLDYLASISTKIITLTVTEKGYHYDQSTRSINWESEDIMHDALYPNSPVSMPGYLVLACQKRMNSEHLHSSKLTIISCDNLPENGHVIGSVIQSLASKLDTKLADWIRRNVTFCSSMVDRIVPSVSQLDIEEQAKLLGYIDKALIITEPFKQWVIEDNFCTERPDWESAGVMFVKNVSDYEKLKLRTLNGSHSALAYMGVLLGHTWIHEAIRDPLLAELIRRLMTKETGPTVPQFEGFNLADYQQQIVQRFLNSDIAYATQQVAMDGSQKLQQRILAPMAELYAKGDIKSTSCLMATFVCWIRYLKRVTESGQHYDIVDPISEVLSIISTEAEGKANRLVDGLFSKTSVVPPELKSNSTFRATLEAQLTQLNRVSIREYLQGVVTEGLTQ